MDQAVYRKPKARDKISCNYVIISRREKADLEIAKVTSVEDRFEFIANDKEIFRKN